jgi:hypothetical protein
MIHPGDGKWFPADWKQGLMSAGFLEVTDAWIFKLRDSPHSLPANVRFYFTEKNWREIGRRVIAARQRSGQRYRIISIKERDAQVCWRDNHDSYEVAIHPKRNRKDNG